MENKRLWPEEEDDQRSLQSEHSSIHNPQYYPTQPRSSRGARDRCNPQGKPRTLTHTTRSSRGARIRSNFSVVEHEFEYGLSSSSQIRTNDVHNVVLPVVDPSSIHHYIFWVWPMLSLVHIIMEFHLHGNLDELLLSPSAAFCLSHESCWTST